MRKKNNPNELTTREKSILEFIRQKIWDSGFPPTRRSRPCRRTDHRR